MLTRERVRHVQSEKWRRLLPPAVQEEARQTRDAQLQQPKIQTEKGLQQHPNSKLHGQEKGHPHVAGDRGAVLPLLDADLRRQRLASLRQTFDRSSPLRSADILHSLAVLHLRLRQSYSLLFYEQTLQTGHSGDIQLL